MAILCTDMINIHIPYTWYIWQIWLQSPNLMYANTTYNHVNYEQCTLNIALFDKPKCSPMCMMSQFTKLIVRQIYGIYSWPNYICTLEYMDHWHTITTGVLNCTTTTSPISFSQPNEWNSRNNTTQKTMLTVMSFMEPPPTKNVTTCQIDYV